MQSDENIPTVNNAIRDSYGTNNETINLRQENYYNQDPAAKQDYLTDSLQFNMTSALQDKFKHKQYKNAELVSAETARVLQKVAKQYSDPDTGKTVLNAVHKNIWFSKHVYMLFSIGRIFDRNDQNFMESVMNYFNKNNEMYLSAKHDVMNYSDELIGKIEKQIGIENGNYHIMLVLIVYASDEELLESPEFLFNTSGIVKWAIESDEIKEIMLTFLNRYGIATENFTPTKIPRKISNRRDDDTLKENSYKLSSTVDWNSQPNRLLFSDLKYRNDRDKDFATRTRTQEDKRINGLRERPAHNRALQDTLYERIHDRKENLPIGFPQAKKVVMSKMVEFSIPTEYANNGGTEFTDMPENRVPVYNIYGTKSHGNINKQINNQNSRKEINGKMKNMSIDYSVLADYGVDSKLSLKSPSVVKRNPGRTINKS